ncbi:hypothetical protein [Treponema pedis]|uniref:hypothetical protein n=1 Tax=Treponema pedis TaxID=409322 RepID=UPI000413F5EE|nr:hypothetical protein [Treponema pedis]QSI04662.1 hypothetical protein DYQ05_06785 [Treponema pedis]
MKTLSCDICGKELVKPIKGRTYWHIREYDVCEDCKEKVEMKLRPVLRNHFPFSQEWYENEFVSAIARGVSAGRA